MRERYDAIDVGARVAGPVLTALLGDRGGDRVVGVQVEDGRTPHADVIVGADGATPDAPEFSLLDDEVAYIFPSTQD